jgi:hypothetical protein
LDIIAIVRDGSLKKRCDFLRAAPQSDELRWIPTYVPGMHDLMRLVHIDAARAAAEGDLAALADRLAVLYRVCGHLGADPSLISALVAHQHFITTHDQMADVLGSGLLNGLTSRALSIPLSESVARTRSDSSPHWPKPGAACPATS